jgi:hypothetical protein
MNARQRLEVKWSLRAANVRSVRTLSSKEFEVIVVFTRGRFARRAIKMARRMVKGLSARIRLLVPHIVPYGVPLDKPLVSMPFLERRFRIMIDGIDVETRVDIRLCRNRWQMLERVLAPGSVVVMGGRRSRWWPSAENRLAKKLVAAGHNVVLV